MCSVEYSLRCIWMEGVQAKHISLVFSSSWNFFVSLTDLFLASCFYADMYVHVFKKIACGFAFEIFKTKIWKRSCECAWNARMRTCKTSLECFLFLLHSSHNIRCYCNQCTHIGCNNILYYCMEGVHDIIFSLLVWTFVCYCISCYLGFSSAFLKPQAATHRA
jgi:hypothetical protein